MNSKEFIKALNHIVEEGRGKEKERVGTHGWAVGDGKRGRRAACLSLLLSSPPSPGRKELLVCSKGKESRNPAPTSIHHGRRGRLQQRGPGRDWIG